MVPDDHIARNEVVEVVRDDMCIARGVDSKTNTYFAIGCCQLSSKVEISQVGMRRYEVCKVIVRRPMEVVQEVVNVREDEVDAEVAVNSSSSRCWERSMLCE